MILKPIEEDNAQTARTVLRDRRLYKFRSMADELQCGRLRDIVLGNRIRFSKPSELNDPLEGKPIYVLGDWTSNDYRSKFAEWAWNTQQLVPNKPPETEFRKWVLAQPEVLHRQQVDQINQDNHAAIEQRWRILSLAASSTHDLLWSHYADGHRGVALVFDASYGEFSFAFQVSYERDRRSLDITSQDLNHVLRVSILSKRSGWSYEEEFRCIGTEEEQFGSLYVPGQFFHFAPTQLIGLIMGANISPQNESLVRQWRAERSTPLQLFKARITQSGAVEIADLA